MEERITFLSDGLEIEGLLDAGDGDKGVVITHPHPLYGGDMYNYVVETIAKVYKSKGYTTLRFNFRGVGGSQGNHDKGAGEQKDVLAAISFLEDRGIKEIDLAGYSYGAWVNAMAVLSAGSIDGMVMVSPPVGFVEFDKKPLPKLKLVVTGSNDDIAPAVKSEQMMTVWNPKGKFKMIKGADHFFSGFTGKLEKVLASGV